MNILEIYSNKEVINLIKKYNEITGENNIEDIFKKSAEDIVSNQCIIPILGTQGSGKSSFLNALLFCDIILPVDADETTCIPTAIVYGEHEGLKAFVYFKDGQKKEIECTEKALADYVHQEKNPGNELGISHIEITVRNELLRNGITLVDLPGVGSITAENQQTTLDYLKKSTGAIFMLRTVPPITQSEACFIQGALPLMGNVFWVQNQWTDESKSEVEEGKEHNYKVLMDIAQKIHISQDRITKPTIVCVKRALDGGINGNEEKIKDSFLPAFAEKIVNFALSWRDEVRKSKITQVETYLEASIVKAKNNIELLQGDIEKESQKIKEEKKQAEKRLEDNKEILEQVQDFLCQEKRKLESIISTECRHAAENLRNSVRSLIDSGTVDGKQLNRAFGDYMKEQNEQLFGNIQPKIMKMLHQITRDLGDLQECHYQEVHTNISSNFTTYSNFVDHSDKIGGIGGSVLGGAAGIKAASFTTGIIAKSTVIGSIIPGGGTAAGFIVGSAIVLGGTLLGCFTGNKVKKHIKDTRKEEACRELFDYIREYQSDCEKKYKKSIDTFKEQIEEALEKWIENQEEEIRDQYKRQKEILNMPIEERTSEIEKIKKDIEVLNYYKKEIEHA